MKRIALFSSVVALVVGCASSGPTDSDAEGVDAEPLSSCGLTPKAPTCNTPRCTADGWVFWPVAAGTPCTLPSGPGVCDGGKVIATSIEPLAQGVCVAPTPPQTLAQIVDASKQLDINGDGVREVEDMYLLESSDASGYGVPTPNGTVVIFVDPRLVADVPGNAVSRAEMLGWLGLYRSDLVNEGWDPRFVVARMHRGMPHQDGRSLLAMRRVLQKVSKVLPLRGSILIGDFPEASLVRRVSFKEHHDDPKNPKKIGSKTLSTVDFYTVASELIASRTDLVLADLDGAWENLYQPSVSFQDVEMIPDGVAPSAFPTAGQVLSAHDFNVATRDFTDVFVVRDDTAKVAVGATTVTASVSTLVEPNPELALGDHGLANPIARPDIQVTRINPRHVAKSPHLTDLDGKSPLAADGKPQTLRVASADAAVAWEPDPSLERRLLVDYLKRNHQFRHGGDRTKPFRTSAVRGREYQNGVPVASGLVSPAEMNANMRHASSSFAPSTALDDALLDQYATWFTQPAVLRGISAHSGEINSLFGHPSSVQAFEAAAGGRPWQWRPVQSGSEHWLVPSLAEYTVDAQFALYRTMWENQVLANAGQSFYLHDGCEVNKPRFVETAAYDDPNYGDRQNAESILFYANGLAMMSRAKVFFDAPRGFYERVAQTGRFGDGLAGYVSADAGDPDLHPANVADWPSKRRRTLARKKTYFWSVIGDFTLRIRY